MLIRRFLQILFPLIALDLLIIVWSVPIANAGGWAAFWESTDLAALTYRLFQLAGLTAFTLVSFQVLTGPYLKLWEKLYGPQFYRFHAFEGIFALLFALLHPSLLLVSLAYQKISLFTFIKAFPIQYYFGPLALTLMLVTVTTAALTILRKVPRFAKTWHWLHLLNYAVFVLAYFHSLTIGSDLVSPTSQLRPLWNFFLIGLVVGLIYRRIYRVVQEKDHGLAS